MNIIKRLRVESDLSQGAFGALFDASASHISRIESGLKVPPHSFLQKVAQHYNLRVDDLEAAMQHPANEQQDTNYKALYELCTAELRQLKLEITELKLKLHFQSQAALQEHFLEN
jgi:transcriptional regulator with XRE-family HTH domain